MVWWKQAARAATALAILAAVSRAGEADRPATAGGTSYEDHTYHFALDGPKFPADPAVPSLRAVSMFAPANRGFSDNVNVVLQPKSTRADYAALNRQSMAAMHMTVVAEQNRQVGGHDAVQIEYAGTLTGRSLHFLSLAVFADDHTYLTTCTATADTFAAEQPEFQRCLDSFRLTAP